MEEQKEQIRVSLTREQWQLVTLALGDAVRVHTDESHRAAVAALRELSARNADANLAVKQAIHAAIARADMAETLSGVGVLTYFPFDSLNAVTVTCRATSTGRTEVVIDPLTGDVMDRFTIPRENVILWEPCGCPNCDDPTDNLACRKDFCAECSRELGHEAVWPDYCERCALRVDRGR